MRIVCCATQPHNIFLAQDGSAQIGDFGLSRIMKSNDSLGTTATYTANVGSPAYSECPIHADMLVLRPLLIHPFLPFLFYLILSLLTPQWRPSC